MQEFYSVLFYFNSQPKLTIKTQWHIKIIAVLPGKNKEGGKRKTSSGHWHKVGQPSNRNHDRTKAKYLCLYLGIACEKGGLLKQTSRNREL